MAPVQPAPAHQGDQAAEKVAKVCRFFSCFSLKFRDPLQIQQRRPSNRIVFFHSWNTSGPEYKKHHPAADADDGWNFFYSASNLALIFISIAYEADVIRQCVDKAELK
jgi:hypothetical protein